MADAYLGCNAANSWRCRSDDSGSVDPRSLRGCSSCCNGACSWPDIREWYRQLILPGLRHRQHQDVTIGALVASVMVFGLGYAGARLFQGWLDAQVLQPAGISGGVRQSIRTGVGYVGIMVAALAAFSYAGFNLSSLAIIAGALSLGIGFGLQNLVNNFVSGLILLAERRSRSATLSLSAARRRAGR